MSVKCLHIADIHLDSPFRHIRKINDEFAKRMQMATEQSFIHLVDVAIKEQVDIVLIVGDSFNSVKPSVRSQLFFKTQLERLVANNIAVVLSFGNHDYYHNNLLVDFTQNIHVFGKDIGCIELAAKSGETISVYGFSYFTNHVRERMIQHYPKRSPYTDFSIGMLHGYLEGIQSDEGIYAPFSLKELNEKQYDYWALGHIHKQQLLQENPPIAYSGCIQGLNRNEIGEKGAILITLEKQKVAKLQFVNSAPIIWKKKTIVLRENQNLEEIIAKVQSYAVEQDKMILLSIEWSIQNGLDDKLYNLLNTDEMKELLSSQQIIVVKETIRKQDGITDTQIDSDFTEKWHYLKEHVPEHSYNQAMESLFKHTKLRTLLPNLRYDKNIEHEITQNALQRLESVLAKGVEHENN